MKIFEPSAFNVRLQLAVLKDLMWSADLTLCCVKCMFWDRCRLAKHGRSNLILIVNTHIHSVLYQNWGFHGVKWEGQDRTRTQYFHSFVDSRMLLEMRPPAESTAGFCTQLSDGMDRLGHAECNLWHRLQKPSERAAVSLCQFFYHTTGRISLWSEAQRVPYNVQTVKPLEANWWCT